MRNRILAMGVLAAALAALAIWRTAPDQGPATETLLHDAGQALSGQQYAEAERLAAWALEDAPDSTRALVIAAEAALRAGHPQRAITYSDRVADDAGQDGVAALCLAGESLLTLGQPSAAEQRFRRVIQRQPHSEFANSRLASLLVLEGRSHESLAYLTALLKARQTTLLDLQVLANPHRFLGPREELERFRRADPDDLLPLIGMARLALEENQRGRAEQSLRQVLAAHPDQLEAQAWLGAVLLNVGESLALDRWQTDLPRAAWDHPLVWIVVGERALRSGDQPVALRCYWEAARRAPNERAAARGLGQLLAVVQMPEQARRFAERADQLLELERTVVQMLFHPHDRKLVRNAARLTAALGRTWEAAAWCQIVAADPSEGWAVTMLAQLEAELAGRSRDAALVANPALAIDLSAYPLPAASGPSTPGVAPAPATTTQATPRFRDDAASAGIDFIFVDGFDPAEGGRRIQQTTGGGVAVLDFDGDGWPDLHFTQGCAWPPQPGQSTHLDRLYRNLKGECFQDVTTAAGLGDNRYSQGVAAGDFDLDGFPDLYLANVGVNRLWRNNGDGTFSEVAAEGAALEEGWTTSCLIADLNGDAWPDLYDVNYLQGQDVYERRCETGPGVYRACAPLAFLAQQDRLRLGTGDGRFEDWSLAAGIQAPEGNGLGIVAADLDASGQLDLYIANDQTPNFLFVNQSPGRGGGPIFSEQGLIAGLALGGDGRAQGSMGIAAGDADGDGGLDLYVTNFYRESNTLYLRQSLGLVFFDGTSQAGLRDPGFSMVGFGAQFLDGELDGWPDLIVTNGHVDDYSDIGIPFRMPPQYYRNLGRGRFEELSAEALGPFFQGSYLGRGLARLDWNRDGREDVAISHIGSPAALLTNETPAAGHFLALQFRAVSTARDAIGTAAIVTAGGRERYAQLTAGDGYQACNQRQLVFGLGTAEVVDKLTVRWPSGLEQTFHNLPADAELILVEGRAEPALLVP